MRNWRAFKFADRVTLRHNNKQVWAERNRIAAGGSELIHTVAGVKRIGQKEGYKTVEQRAKYMSEGLKN